MCAAEKWVRVPHDPRHNLPTDQMIQADGYVAETHTVETDDGNILTMHRIPYGRDTPADQQTGRPVVFLQGRTSAYQLFSFLMCATHSKAFNTF